MNQYVRCLKNNTYFKDDLADSFIDLKIGNIYKRLPTSGREADSGMIRVVDGSGESYLYPADYFEPLPVGALDKQTDHQVTVHLDEVTKGTLQAEALAAQKSVSALLREWIEEHLDLPVNS
jgi:hypothetical protein